MPSSSCTTALLAALTIFCAASPAGAETPTVIVKYRHGLSAARRTAIARRAGLGPTVGAVHGQGARVARVTGDPAMVARRLDRSPGVRFAEPNLTLRTTAVPDDPLFDQLGGLTAVHASSGWDLLGLSSFPARGGVPIGLVDTGIDEAHQDLAGKAIGCATARGGRLTEGACADDNGHGTHVAGTAAAIANNRTGVAGLAFNSPLIICKALAGSDGSGTTADVASCIDWVHDRGARVISMSLGGPASITLQNAVRAAWAGGRRSGSLLVAAAGNEGDASLEYPAGYTEVVSVAATNATGVHAAFSNSNDDVELAAPGVGILSTARGGGYVRLSGTSMATPHVAAAAALLCGANRRSAARTVRSLLDRTVADLGPAGRDPQFGYGLLDLTTLPAE